MYYDINPPSLVYWLHTCHLPASVLPECFISTTLQQVVEVLNVSVVLQQLSKQPGMENGAVVASGAILLLHVWYTHIVL